MDINNAFQTFKDFDDWFRSKENPAAYPKHKLRFIGSVIKGEKPSDRARRRNNLLTGAQTCLLEQGTIPELKKVTDIIDKTLIYTSDPKFTSHTDEKINGVIDSLKEIQKTFYQELAKKTLTNAKNIAWLKESDILALERTLQNRNHLRHFTNFIQQANRCQIHNYERVYNQGRLIDLFDNENKRLDDIFKEVSKELPKECLSALRAILDATAPINAFDAHFETLTLGLYTPRDTPLHIIKKLKLPPQEKIEGEFDLTWSQEKEKRMEAIAKSMAENALQKELAPRGIAKPPPDLLIGYTNIGYSTLKERAVWRDIRRNGEQFFVKGTREISFLTPAGNEKKVQVELDLTSLGNLSRDECKHIFYLLYWGVEDPYKLSPKIVQIVEDFNRAIQYQIELMLLHELRPTPSEYLT